MAPFPPAGKPRPEAFAARALSLRGDRGDPPTTWLALMRSIPMADGTFSALRVLTPFVAILETAAITARSAR